MFDLGIQELVVIFIVALIVFGPKRLPELGRTLGRGISEMRKVLKGVKEQIDADVDISPDASDSKPAKPWETKNKADMKAWPPEDAERKENR